MENFPGEKILISVVTPVYRGEAFVQSAYDCLCRQTYQNWEWVVVDDGSDDGTYEKLEALAMNDPRIRCFQQKNSGSAKGDCFCQAQTADCRKGVQDEDL